jgi:hypothetical protein
MTTLVIVLRVVCQPLFPLARGLWPVVVGQERGPADRAATGLGCEQPPAGLVDRHRVLQGRRSARLARAHVIRLPRYTFRPRLSKNRFGKHFLNFSPAVSGEAKTRMRREMRSWGVARRSDKTLTDLALMFNRRLQG